MQDLVAIGYALIGALVGSFLACVPALHVYNAAALAIVALPHLGSRIPGQPLVMLFLGLVVGYALLNAVPSLFLGAPDESVAWLVLPGQRYLLQGRGHDAAVLSGVGSLGALIVVLLLAPLAGVILTPLRQVVEPHLHWLLALIVVYLLLSEWPKGTGRGKHMWDRLWDGCKSVLAGWATFLLAGILGILNRFSPLVPLEASFQGLMPAFVGLFAIPWVLQNIVSRTQVPEQRPCTAVDLTPGLIGRGVGAGTLGGLLAAFLPGITGGIGGLVAGHATAQRDDRVFIISQGTCKTLYYIGSLLLFFVPGSSLTRGGMAWMLSPFYRPGTPREYWLAIAAVLLCGALAFVMLLWLSRCAAMLVSRVDYHLLSWGTLALLVMVVAAATGWRGLLVALPATGIGLIPVMFHARRTNCMGVLLLPLLLDMAGLGATAAGWLGLLR